MLQPLLSGAIDNLTGAANVLGTPGAMVNRALMGENPLMPLLSPWEGKYHRQGRDVLRHHGLIGKKDTWGNFAAGLAVDLITDPTMWLMPGKAALTPMGTMAKKAGLLRYVGRPLQAGGKSRAALGRLTEHGIDLLKRAPKEVRRSALRSLRQQARQAKIPVSQVRRMLHDAPLAGWGGIGMPIVSGKPWVVFGATGRPGRIATGWATAKDTLAHHAARSWPGRTARRLFSSKATGMGSDVGQHHGFDMSAMKDAYRAVANRQSLDYNRALQAAGLHRPEAARHLARLRQAKTLRKIENAADTALRDPAMQGVTRDNLVRFGKHHQAVERAMRHTGELAGMPTSSLPDGNMMQLIQDFHGARLNADWASRVLADPGAWVKGGGRGGVPLAEVARKLNLDPDRLVERLAKVPGHTRNRLTRRRVDLQVAEDLVKALDSFKPSGRLQGILGKYDDFNALWKRSRESVSPGAHPRTRIGGFFRNLFDHSHSRASRRAVKDMINGKSSSFWRTHPLIRNEVRRRGMKLAEATDDDLTRIARELQWQFEAGAEAAGDRLAHTTLAQGSPAEHLADFHRQLPGQTEPMNYRSAVKKLFGDDTTWNPLTKRTGGKRLERVLGKPAEYRSVGGAKQSTFAPMAARDRADAVAQLMNRAPAWWELTRQGFSPEEAARMVRLSHGDLRRQAFSPFVRKALLRLFPTGKKPIAMFKKLGHELANRPGGRHAAAIRLADRLQREVREPGEEIPEWRAEHRTVKLGETPDGASKYLTNFGLPDESALDYLPVNPQQFGRHLLDQLGPVPKLAGEWVTGQTFSERQPPDRRALQDVDPAIGRTLRSIQQRIHERTPFSAIETEPTPPVTFPGSQTAEHILSRLPFSQVASTAKTLVDPNRSALDRLLELGTGLRTFTVPPTTAGATPPPPSPTAPVTAPSPSAAAPATRPSLWSFAPAASPPPSPTAPAVNVEGMSPETLARLASGEPIQPFVPPAVSNGPPEGYGERNRLLRDAAIRAGVDPDTAYPGATAAPGSVVDLSQLPAAFRDASQYNAAIQAGIDPNPVSGEEDVERRQREAAKQQRLAAIDARIVQVERYVLSVTQGSDEQRWALAYLNRLKSQRNAIAGGNATTSRPAPAGGSHRATPGVEHDQPMN